MQTQRVTLEYNSAKGGELAADAVGCSVNDLNPRYILDEFFDRFFDDILGYHESTIVELLNDIRWAIQEYLRVPFQHAFVRGNERPAYSYCIPHHVNSQREQDSFCALMESYRGGGAVSKVQYRWLFEIAVLISVASSRILLRKRAKHRAHSAVWDNGA